MSGERSPLRVEGLAKRYGETLVFRDVFLEARPGEVIALLGESGVGKSTLLNCIAGLDSVSEGRVFIDDVEVGALDERDQALLRRVKLGFVFQAFHVLPYLTVADNVGLPLLLLGRPDADRVDASIRDVGLAGFGARMPRTLSGGQLQRVAIARALVHRPRLLLADEPTGNLDPATAAHVLDLLVVNARNEKTACLIATHSTLAAERADRVLRLTSEGLAAGTAAIG